MERTIEIEELLGEAGWLRGLAASLVGDGAAAEDLVQDTWLAALRRPPRAGPGQAGEPRPWLARVARNLARNAGRARARRRSREESAHAERASLEPAMLAQEAEAQRLLAEAVTRLAEPLRAVIVLRYFQGLDSGAAAARLGVPASTVRTRLQRALDELRAHLDRRFDGERRGWVAFLAPLAAPRSSAIVSSGGAASAGSLASSSPWLAGAAALCVLAAIGARRWNSARQRVEPRAAAALAPEASTGAAGRTTATPSSERQELLAGASSSASIAPGAPDSERTPTELSGVVPGHVVLSGIVRVDGQPPEWPLRLTLEPALPAAPPAKGAVLRRVRPLELELAPEQHGSFAFEGLAPDWSGRLRVSDYDLADGSPALDVPAPATGLVVALRSGPEVTGRIRASDGRQIAGLEGSYRFRAEGASAPVSARDTKRFVCRADGAVRIPRASAGERVVLELAVDDPVRGFLRHEASLAPAPSHDLGELELEPLHALSFTVRDARGEPLAGALARVDGPALGPPRPLTGADGRGVLALAPDRSVDVRFSALGYADRVLRVEPGSAPEVALEPLATLALCLSGAAASADHVRISAARAAFAWDELGWDEHAELQLELGRAKKPARRTPAADGQRFEYEFGLSPEDRFELAGVTPDLALSVEALDADGRALAVATVEVAREQRLELVLGAGDASGGVRTSQRRRAPAAAGDGPR